MRRNLLQNVQIDWVDGVEAAGSSIDVNSTIKDMQGWDGVVVITEITDSADTGVGTLSIQENSANSDTGMANITGATAAGTSAADDDLNDTLLIVDCYKPMERYVQATRISATANIAYGPVIMIRYQGRKSPITQDSTTVTASTQVVGS